MLESGLCEANCDKIYIGAQGEDLSTVKVLYPLPRYPTLTLTPVVYVTDRSKAVVLLWFLACVAL